MESIAAQAEGDEPALASADSGLPPESIAARQNLSANIDLLAAQRQLYSEAKQLRRVRAWSVAAMAVIGVAVPFVASDLVKGAGVVGFIVTVVQWIIGIIEKRRTKMAATVQEQFDTSVFPLPWNSVLGNRVDPEDLVAAARRFTGDRNDLMNWYRIPTETPRPLDILLCQRSNLRWDAALRRTYALAVVAGLVGLYAVIVAVALWADLSRVEFASTIVSTAGVLLFGADTVWTHYQHSAAQLDLKRKVEAACERARGRKRSLTVADVRAIQTEIYRQRVTALTVPDYFYWKRREQFELEMREAVDRLWQEFSRPSR
ncbi:MAG: S-4TM family putative pore-forming effector [Chloroflexota bacterium]